MSIEDTCRDDGLLCGLGIAAEAITYAGRQVAAIVDVNPLAYQMADAGFNPVGDVSLEVFKGTTTSTDTTYISGVLVPLDLRGVIPQNLDTAIVRGENRTVRNIRNSGDAWIIETAKAN